MPKRLLQGVVVSDKNDKTIVVKVERRFTHPLMKKTVRRTKKYHAHDETNRHKTGESVWIEETKPISKNKRWVVIESDAQGAPIRGSRETSEAVTASERPDAQPEG